MFLKKYTCNYYFQTLAEHRLRYYCFTFCLSLNSVPLDRSILQLHLWHLISDTMYAHDNQTIHEIYLCNYIGYNISSLSKFIGSLCGFIHRAIYTPISINCNFGMDSFELAATVIDAAFLFYFSCDAWVYSLSSSDKIFLDLRILIKMKSSNSV